MRTIRKSLLHLSFLILASGVVLLAQTPNSTQQNADEPAQEQNQPEAHHRQPAGTAQRVSL